jgi:regulator of sigma E protease
MLSSISPYIAPLLVFGLVVFIHELGHFAAAKMVGVYAPVFSLGWGRRVFGWRRGETDYRVSLIPLGGYVRMATRDDDSLAGIEGGADRGSLDGGMAEKPADIPAGLWDNNAMAPFGPKAVPPHRWIESKSIPARVFVLSAGVLMNVLLAYIVSSGIFFAYGKPSRDVMIDSVTTGAPAALAGLQAGDHIVAVNGQPIRGSADVVERISPVTSGSVAVEVRRGAERRTLQVTPQPADIKDPTTGATRRVGRVGVAMRDSLVHEKVGIARSLMLGGTATWSITTNIIDVLRGLVSGQVSMRNVGGPLQIVQTSVQAARSGAEMLWSLIAFLSLNIAIMNLVPIPVLDGGQILLVLAEGIKGSEFSVRTREAFARVGVVAVLALIVLVTVNDIRTFIESFLSTRS